MNNERNEYSQVPFDEIRSHFGDKTIKERYSFLYEKIQEYIDTRYENKELKINEDILHQAVMDYFSDIYRLKKFHKIERVNISKIVAYEVYWLWRRKPIQLMDEVGNSSKKVFSNEGFLTVFIAHELLGEEASIPMTDEQEKIYLNFLNHVYYCLKYRGVDKQSLETMLIAMETGKSISLQT